MGLPVQPVQAAAARASDKTHKPLTPNSQPKHRHNFTNLTGWCGFSHMACEAVGGLETSGPDGNMEEEEEETVERSQKKAANGRRQQKQAANGVSAVGGEDPPDRLHV